MDIQYPNNMHTHTMEYYLTLKMKEILTLATTCMNSEDVILSEMSHSQEDTYTMTPLVCDTWCGPVHRDRK